MAVSVGPLPAVRRGCLRLSCLPLCEPHAGLAGGGGSLRLPHPPSPPPGLTFLKSAESCVLFCLLSEGAPIRHSWCTTNPPPCVADPPRSVAGANPRERGGATLRG